MNVYLPEEVILVNGSDRAFPLTLIMWGKLVELARRDGFGWQPIGTMAPPYDPDSQPVPYPHGYFKHEHLVTIDDAREIRKAIEHSRRSWESATSLAGRDLPVDRDGTVRHRLLLLSNRQFESERVRAIEQECQRIVRDNSILLADYSAAGLNYHGPPYYSPPPIPVRPILQTAEFKVVENYMLTPGVFFRGRTYTQIVDDFVRFTRSNFLITLV
jgi:hypothetical protein